MRIAITTLPSPASVSLRGMLEQGGYVLVTADPDYTVDVLRSRSGVIELDIADSIFGRLLTHQIGALSPNGGVFVVVKAGNQSEKKAVICVPDDAGSLQAVCVGTLRALDKLRAQLAKAAATKAPRRWFWRR